MSAPSEPLEPGETGVMAQAYVAYGWSVFPLWWVCEGVCACPQARRCTSPGKHPLTRHGVLDASRDRLTVGEWFFRRWPLANIGLPMGDNGLAALDVDPRHRGDVSLALLSGRLGGLPQTLTQRTGSGGSHLVFRAPEGGIKGGSGIFGEGLDVRGRGGYIVAAPSMHAAGRRYEWVNFWIVDPAPWPQSLDRLRLDARPEAPAAVDRPLDLDPGEPDRYVAVALAGELQRVRETPEGGRNHALNRAAFSLGQLVEAGLLDRSKVQDELTQAGRDAGLGAAEIRATIRSGLRAGAARPRGRADNSQMTTNGGDV